MYQSLEISESCAAFQLQKPAEKEPERRTETFLQCVIKNWICGGARPSGCWTDRASPLHTIPERPQRLRTNIIARPGPSGQCRKQRRNLTQRQIPSGKVGDARLKESGQAADVGGSIPWRTSLRGGWWKSCEIRGCQAGRAPKCAADVAELRIHAQNGESSVRIPRYFDLCGWGGT